jgi:hypothetical protein
MTLHHREKLPIGLQCHSNKNNPIGNQMKFIAKKRFLTLFLLLLSHTTLANIALTDHTTIVFATVSQGQQVLSSNDDFVSRLSPFDRASRLKTDKPVSLNKYLSFVKKQVQPWSEQDIQKLTEAFAPVRRALTDYALPLPKQILMIKTSGDEEGHAAYTRANAIMFGDKQISHEPAKLQYLLFHELFHVLSRSDQSLKRRLYQSIGFHKADELQFPSTLSQRKITNPDAPINDHYIHLSHQGKAFKAVPILFSNTQHYDTQKGGEFFNYLNFKLIVVDHDIQKGTMVAQLKDGKPQLLDVADIADFSAQIGKNTGYIIHPEEILADNFAFLLGKRQKLKSPEIIKNIAKILEQ